MMRPKQILARLAALLVFLSSCADESPDEPAVSASVTEDVIPEVSEAITSPPETEEITEAVTLPATVPQTEVSDLPAQIILDIAELLTEVYTSYTRTSSTETEIDILGEITRSESHSELTISGKNALFRRGDEEYCLIDGYLCYVGSLGKYRIGGHDTSSFAELFGDMLPSSAFEDGTVERGDEEILLLFDKLTEDGEAAIRNMLGLGNGYSIDIQTAELRVRTDEYAHLKTRELSLKISVSANGEELMKVTLSSETEQSRIDEQIALDLPELSDYVLFPDTETVALYEAAFADYASFVTSHQAFEFTEKDEMRVSADGTDITLTSETDYAYASLIGASIERTFDIADGTGKHTVLSHFNNKHGFSQIDGGSIFVDTTLNKNNLFSNFFYPFETSVYQIGGCVSVESAENGKIVLTLNDDTAEIIAQNILLHAGVLGSDINILETERAVTFITLDESGKAASAGYSFAAQVSADGKVYTLSRDVSLEITSRGTAKVKVIYIEVEEEEE